MYVYKKYDHYMLVLVQALFLLYSIFEYRTAPQVYQYSFCYKLAMLSLVQNAIYFLNTKRSLLSFEFLFFFAFYFTNYVYPIEFYPTDPTYSLFKFKINYNIISRATALSFMAYSAYMFGMSLFVKKEDSVKNERQAHFSKSSIQSIFIIAALSMGIYILYIGRQMFQGYDWYFNPKNYTPLASLAKMMCLLFSIMMWREIKNLNGNNAIYIIAWVMCVLIFLRSGSRHFLLSMLLILICSFSENIKRIPSLAVIVLMILGAALLFIIQRTRIQGWSIDTIVNTFQSVNNGHGIYETFEDLIINNRNLYALVDYADTHGLTYGRNMLTGILGIIPLGGKLYSHFTGIDQTFLQTSLITTYLAKSSYGLGGHIVADVYLSFGWKGTLAIFTAFGCFMGLIIKYYKKNQLCYITYYVMIASSIFMNREFLLLPLRDIVYSIILFKLFTSKNKDSDKEYEQIPYNSNSDI